MRMVLLSQLLVPVLGAHLDHSLVTFPGSLPASPSLSSVFTAKPPTWGCPGEKSSCSPHLNPQPMELWLQLSSIFPSITLCTQICPLPLISRPLGEYFCLKFNVVNTPDLCTFPCETSRRSCLCSRCKNSIFWYE